LLINVNNYNSLILRLIRTYDSEIINTLIIQNIFFPDDIREIRYYSSEFKINTEDNDDNSKDNNINEIVLILLQMLISIIKIIYSKMKQKIFC